MIEKYPTRVESMHVHHVNEAHWIIVSILERSWVTRIICLLKCGLQTDELFVVGGEESLVEV